MDKSNVLTVNSTPRSKRLAIYNVCFGDGIEVRDSVVDELVNDGILLKSKTGKFSMSKDYQRICSEIGPSSTVSSGVYDSQNDKLNDRRNDKLSDSVRKTYKLIKANPGLQRKGIALMVGKSVPTIDRHIAILVKESLVEHRDADKTGGYYAK